MIFAPPRKQRRSERQWITVPILIGHAGSRIDGFSINISEGGVYLFAAANLAVGARIELNFRSPDRKRLIHASGIVRRRALYLYGIELLADDAATTQPHECSGRQSTTVR
jgi:hypothetical protein